MSDDIALAGSLSTPKRGQQGTRASDTAVDETLRQTAGAVRGQGVIRAGQSIPAALWMPKIERDRTRRQTGNDE